ncbi:MAG: hypothetical protein IAF38_00980, partial [Bacteroidia bacterium]|nr:hypothetical protein [Bacteroidia bacterium]
KKKKEKTKVLKGKVITSKVVYRNDIRVDNNKTSREIVTLNAWLGLSGL